MKRLLLRWESMLLVILAAEIFIFGAVNPRFLDLSSLLYSSGDFAYIGMAALPLTLIIITGAIDISFGAGIGLCAVAFGVCNYWGLPLPVSVGMALILGALTGVFNALMIHFSGIQALVVTLGCMYLFSGGATVLSGLAGAGGFEGIGNFPEAFTNFSLMSMWGVPMPTLLLLALALVLGFLLHSTRTGRKIYLLGLNPDAAKYSGLSAFRLSMLCSVLLGLCAALAGLSMASYYGSARTDLGSAALLPAITAVVLGGASIYGGKGSILGTLLAVFIVGYLQQGLQMSGVASQISTALSGALLVIAVALRQSGRFVLRWAEKVLRPQRAHFSAV